MGVAGDHGDRSAFELELIGDLFQDGLHEGAADFAVIEGDHDEAFAGGILEREGLDQERMVDAIGGAISSGVTGEFDGQLGGDIADGDADLRIRVQWRRRPRMAGTREAAERAKGAGAGSLNQSGQSPGSRRNLVSNFVANLVEEGGNR